jgi:hydrogenase maturation protease
VRGGEKPGTIYMFTPDEIKKSNRDLKLSLHDFNLVDVLNLAKALNKKIPEIIIYGIEPESLDWGLEPTETVARAIEQVVSEIVNNLREEYGDEVLTNKESD